MMLRDHTFASRVSAGTALAVALTALNVTPAAASFPPRPGAPAAAQAAPAGKLYFGHHPAPPGQGAFCALAGSHSHPYAPDAAVAQLFREQAGHYYFIGDPYHFGYRQAAYGYDAHHPIHPAFGGGWCYLEGPHHHAFHPHKDEVRSYTSFGGRYYYLGGADTRYAAERPQTPRAAEPAYATSPAYAPAYAARFDLAFQYGHPASVAYVVRGKLPKRYFVPGAYAGAYFGVPGFSAGVAVHVPGVSAHVGVGFPAVAMGVGFGVQPVMAPGVVVVPGGPGYYRGGRYYSHPGKRKGWYKQKRKWKHGKRWKNKRGRGHRGRGRGRGRRW